MAYGVFERSQIFVVQTPHGLLKPDKLVFRYVVQTRWTKVMGSVCLANDNMHCGHI